MNDPRFGVVIPAPKEVKLSHKELLNNHPRNKPLSQNLGQLLAQAGVKPPKKRVFPRNIPKPK